MDPHQPFQSMTHYRSILGLFVVLTLFWACQHDNEEKISDDAIVISNVNIIDVNDGSISQGHVVVDSTTIVKILDVNTSFDEGNATVIDGTGNYLVPGLAEMHAHIPSLPWDDPLIEETLFLYLSNGVTTIRGMLGHPHHLELRGRAADQEILSPRIYTSSPSVSGSTIPTVEDARTKITAYANEGYDFIKIHPGLTLEAFDEVARTAKEVGIPFAGHVSNQVGVRHALESGYATIDHIDAYLEGLVPESANVDHTQNGFFGYNFTDLADRELIPELVEMSNSHQVWVVPTQSLFDRWFSPTDPNILVQEPEMSYISPETRQNWVQSKTNLIGADNYDSATWAKFNDIRFQLIKELQENGYGLLLGSDAPQVFNVPGFSIHHELQGMIQAGLSPLEAIQTGTINPGEFFDGPFGEIKEGLDADFILLENNPLDNIENLENPLGVMARGQWIDRQAIQEKLKQIATNYSSNQ